MIDLDKDLGYLRELEARINAEPAKSPELLDVLRRLKPLQIRISAYQLSLGASRAAEADLVRQIKEIETRTAQRVK